MFDLVGQHHHPLFIPSVDLKMSCYSMQPLADLRGQEYELYTSSLLYIHIIRAMTPCNFRLYTYHLETACVASVTEYKSLIQM